MSEHPESLLSETIRIPSLRMLASILLGFFYGGSLLNGIEEGLDHVLKKQDVYLLHEWPLAESGVMVLSAGLAGTLASHSAQSVLIGMAASVLVSLLSLLVQSDFSLLPINILAWVTCIISLLIGVAGAIGGSKIEISQDDIRLGLLFGVSWKHWLWLWLPWQLTVANAVWVAYPASMMFGIDVPILFLIKEIGKAPVSIALICIGTYKALESIRHDNPITPLQAFLRFLGWFLLFPIAVNLMRMI